MTLINNITRVNNKEHNVNEPVVAGETKCSISESTISTMNLAAFAVKYIYFNNKKEKSQPLIKTKNPARCVYVTCEVGALTT